MTHNIKRIQADLAEIQKELYSDQGIFYEPCGMDITRGSLLVWGPADSVYEDMPMVYSVMFPVDYPFKNPHVLFQTGDGSTRFHPNMYREGKVCLSILGTWAGPSWAATMRLSTVAVTIQSLMDTNPIAHEPGWENALTTDYRCLKAKGYNDLVKSRCILYGIQLFEAYAKDSPFPACMESFRDEWIQRSSAIAKRMYTRITKEMQENEGKRAWADLPYGLSGKADYAELRNRLKKAMDKIDDSVLKEME